MVQVTVIPYLDFCKRFLTGVLVTPWPNPNIVPGGHLKSDLAVPQLNISGGSQAENSASLYTGAKSNPRDSLDEAEKDSFLALLGKGGHSGASALKTVFPNLEKVMRVLY